MRKPRHNISRRDIVRAGVAVGLLGATDAPAQISNTPPNAASKIKVIVTLNGATYIYPDGPTIPYYYVGFREDGRIVFHLGALGDLASASSTTKPYHLPSHQVRIVRDGNVLLDATIPAHWWNAEWTYRPKPLAASNAPARLVATNRMFPFGDTGCQVNSVKNYRFAGPMDTAGITLHMETTGERAEIGWVTDPSANFMLTNIDSPMMAWAEAAGSCPLHFRDESTGKPIDLTKYPTANCYYDRDQGNPWLLRGPEGMSEGAMTPNAWGGGWGPQQAHFVEMSYVAFMATGDLGFLEDLQYEANFCVLCDSTVSAKTRKATVYGEMRGVAWALRQLFMAHVATADAEARGVLPAACHGSTYWRQLLKQSLDFYLPQVTNPSAQNKIFRTFPDSNHFSPWMQDYMLTALAFGLLTGHAEWEPIYVFALGNTIARTNGTSGFPPGWGTPYRLYLYPFAKRVDGTLTMNQFDTSQPLTWWTSFLYIATARESRPPTQNQIDALQADPLNDGIAMQGQEYLMTTRAVLVMAGYLEKKGLVEVRKTYPDLDICLRNANRMFHAYGRVNARVSVVASSSGFQ